jgi:ACS family tartrate transporter-like MFS transporter
MDDHDDKAEAFAHVLPKVRRRLVPFLFLLYIVSYLDRINVGFAALQMNQALGLSATAYGFGAGLFFLSYTAFEVPSNIVLARVGARLWIARIMITWGIVSSSMMFVRGPAGFYALRFLLGAAEAGFFPGIIYYLTEWFPARERARTIAAFMTATLVAGLVGGPISGALLALNDVGGLAGWQWLFLVEGIPAVVLGFVVLGRLTERPREATWLSEAERATLVAVLEHDALVRERAGDSETTIRRALSSRRVWLLSIVYFTIPVALYAFGFWLPQIIKAQFAGSDFQIGVLSAVPYLVGAIGMVVAARHSDRTGERRLHVVAAAVVGGAALALSGTFTSVAGSVAGLSIAMLGLASMFGPFWALATSTLGGIGAAAAIAFINAIGNTGGFVGPYLVGYIRDRTHTFTGGLAGVGTILAVVPLLVLAIRENRLAGPDVATIDVGAPGPRGLGTPER